MKRVFIFMTGQPRCLYNAVSFLVRNFVQVNPQFQFYLMVGLDVEDVQPFQMILHHFVEFTKIQVFSTTRKCLQFQKGQFSVEKLRLSDEWKQYLLFRSGSVLEYAQFDVLLQETLKDFIPNPDDLVLRCRTDVLLLYPWLISNISPVFLTPPMVFKLQFPYNLFLREWVFESGREGCILPEKIRDGKKWVISLRKNLIYLMPFCQAGRIREISEKYGFWDNHQENEWWFNAESQFRGFLRQNGFTVFDFSQVKDECFQTILEPTKDFPVYAIQRSI